MKNPIELLFRSSKASAGSDRLNQKQREAMIDLLVFAMYADNHLAISEDKIIRDEIESFNWESTVTAEHYLERATQRIRNARHNDDSRSELFTYITDRLETNEAKERAAKVCRRLFVSDGAENDVEEAFAAELQIYLGLD